MNNTPSLAAAVRVLLLSVLLFIAALGTHEVMHLLVLYAVGGHGSIIVRPWRLGLVDATIYALHVQPDQPVGLGRQMLVNFLGPILAAVPLAALLFFVREPLVRLALWANVAILVFYAIIEAADLYLESAYEIDLPILTTPEFNYGVPAAIILMATFIAFRQRTEVHVVTG
ncbi:MAG TPA: hypothetical protein VLR46_11675 [Candidatus Dormibacteraeota bacterium]|nr:hypothetical protein [Candidatus Dormibacteraeota bacterium]